MTVGARVVRLLEGRKLPELAPIVKGIPLPPARHQAGTLTRTLRALEVGDSFLWRSSGAVYSAAIAVGIKITVREQSDGWFRIWRTA